MIITEKVFIEINNRTYNYYINRGYKNIQKGCVSEILVKDIPINSHIKVLIKCDKCGSENRELK